MLNIQAREQKYVRGMGGMGKLSLSRC